MAGSTSVASSILSIVFRFLSWSFLRVIPARQYYVSYGALLLYLALWIYNDAKLRYLQKAPKRTIDKQVQNAKTRTIKDEPFASESGKIEDSASASEHARPGDAGAPSYSQIVAAGNKKKAKRDKTLHHASQSDMSPASALTTTEPSMEVQARGLNPPGKPSLISFLTGGLSRSRTFNKIALAMNLVLLAACLDFQFTSYFFNAENDLAFVRVGAVTDTTVNLVARIPQSEEIDAQWISSFRQATGSPDVNNASIPGSIPQGAQIVYRLTQPLGQWQSGPQLFVSNNTDFLGAARIEDLYPSTEYEFRLTLVGLHRTFHPLFPKAQRFVTWADPRLSADAGTHFKFASTSCMLPGWPYEPLKRLTRQDRLRMPGVEHLAKGIKDRGIQWLMNVGDFIYVDVPFSPFPISKETYRQKYRQIYASDAYRKVYEQIPTYNIYDDHEIINDFSSQNSSDSHLFSVANDAFRLYQGLGNPTILPAANAQSDVNYYWFRNGDAAFFVFDTRKYRSKNNAVDGPEKTMLGEIQKAVFFDWLASVNQTTTFKFVISSIPFMTLWDPAEDTYSAFQNERTQLMDVMEYVPNIIVLSGDRHEFAAAAIREKVLEFSTSPLNQFYLPIRTLSQSHGLGATGEDVLLKYLPDGSSKYTTFEVDTRTKNKPIVKVEVVIDGQTAWNLKILGKVVHQPPVKVGRLAPSLAELLGFIKRRWF